MLTTNKVHLFFAISVLFAAILACSTNPASSTPVSQSPTDAPVSVQATPTAETPTSQNPNQPGELPETRVNQAADYDSSTTAQNKLVNGGDRFTYEQFERPFNGNTMDTYFPYLDIQSTSVYKDDIWVFAVITVKGPDASGALAGRYAAEVDTNKDGKGDWLIMVSNPTSTSWSTSGVQVFQDADHSVGAAKAMYTDKNNPGNGYETLVFDQGKGSDPDAAWARIAPNDKNTVELAFKSSLLGSKEFLIGMWAGNSMLDAANFDINDHFTHEQAGEANPGYENFYPIKAVAEIDNSCRMSVGFVPNGSEPGLCPVEIPQQPGTSPSGCTATPAQILACNSDPSYSWSSATCSCKYVGPK